MKAKENTKRQKALNWDLFLFYFILFSYFTGHSFPSISIPFSIIIRNNSKEQKGGK